MKSKSLFKHLVIPAALWLAVCPLTPSDLSAQTLTAQGVGNPSPAGTATENNGVFTIEGGGADIAAGSDQFHYIYAPLPGDGTLTIRVTSLEYTHQYAKAGVMIRESLNADSRFYSTLIHANNSVRFQRRTTTGATMASSGSGSGFPRWLRISRLGNVITSYDSSNGVNWNTLGSENVTNLGVAYIGIAVCSHNTTQLATAVIDNVTFPAGPQFNGFSRIEAESFTAQSGVEIVSGGTGQKIGSIENGTWVKYEDVDFGAGAGTFKARAASNASGGTIEVRLDSQTGALAGSVTVSGTGGWNNFLDVQTSVSGISGQKDLYLVFSGGSGSLFDLDYFEFAASGFRSADVGAVGVPGFRTENGGVITIEGAGSDIGGTSDQFHYVYQPLVGNGTLTVRLASLEYTNQYAKAGVMIRENLTPGARHYTTLVNANGAVRFQRRTTSGIAAISSGSTTAIPRWIRIARSNDVITSSQSADGVNWSQIGSETVSNLGNVYIGLAVSSYSNTQLATAVFNSVSFPTVVDTDGDQLPDAWETGFGLNPNNAADAQSDSDGDGLTNLQEYWGLTSPVASNTPSGGVVTVSMVTAAAYEIDSANGLLRLARTGGTASATVAFALTGTATAEDYILKDSSGNVLNGSVVFPSGLSSLDISVIPVADGSQEYPESLVMTLNGGAGYTVGANASVTATLYDATDTPANEHLFIAQLTPVPGATSSGSGLVQLYLNGPKTSARVSVAPQGLSSSQTNTYIRWGVPEGPGPELRPNLGTGQIANATWSIQPTAQATGQEIIDGLYRNGGKFVYVNIGTGNYPAGEIQGSLMRQTGSSTFSVPVAPPTIPSATGSDLSREVARFLTQATFGPTQAEIDALVTRINTQHGGDRMAGFSAWIDEQLARDFSQHYAYLRAAEMKNWADSGVPPTQQEFRANPGREAGAAWWMAAMKAHDQLRQRYAFALSEIFVIARGMQPLSTFPAGPVKYYDMLGGYTTGNFRDLLEDVSKHPVMGEYLSHKKNRKAIYNAQGKLIASPDENYAREIMQLFSIGLVSLHPDGTLKLNGSGSLIPTYNNDDIANLARVFTGWSYGMNLNSSTPEVPVVNTDFNAGTGAGSVLYSYYPYGWMYPMRNFAQEHDTGTKTFLGANVPAGLDGEQDLDAALNIIFAHPNVAPFISRLLIQRFVTSNPSRGYIYRVAQKFENNGSGVRGDMKAVIKAVLLDYEARALSLTTTASYGKQKEPIIRYIQMLRVCKANGAGLLSDFQPYMDADQYNNYPAGATRYSVRAKEVEPHLGQFPLSAPSVFNWFLPDYSPPGPISAAGLVAPEMNLTTESNVFAVINFFHQITHSYGVDSVTLNLTELVAQYDALRSGGSSHLQATSTLFDSLDLIMTSGSFKALYGNQSASNPRLTIINTVGGLSESNTLNRIKELIYLITTSPEYVHQR